MAKTSDKVERRTVFPSAEVYHVWAHQRAKAGRAKGVQVFFDGPVIYSYGRHFPMARLLLKNGKPVAVLVTTRTYSSTTSGHQSDVRAAVRHLPAFHVENVTETRHAAVLKGYKVRVGEAAAKVVKSLAGTTWALSGLNGLIDQANKYAEFFGLKTRFDYPPGFDAAWHHFRGLYEDEKAKVAAKKREAARAAKWAAWNAADREAREARLAEERKTYDQRLAEYPAKLAAWLAGEGNAFPEEPRHPDRPYDHGDQRARLRVRGSRIETSMGAVVAVEQAKPLLRLVRNPDGVGQLVIPDMAVGGYRGVTVNFVAKTVSVGCHTIDFAEVERVAGQLGL